MHNFVVGGGRGDMENCLKNIFTSVGSSPETKNEKKSFRSPNRDTPLDIHARYPRFYIVVYCYLVFYLHFFFSIAPLAIGKKRSTRHS
jgi:hypothetical protein